MNLMCAILSNTFSSKDPKFNAKLENLKERLKKSGFKVNDKFTKIGDTYYYNNCLPLVNKARDVLKKPEGVCKIKVNWKKKLFPGMTTSEIYDQLKEQWGWTVTTVDAEHSRNKYKNKINAWVVFDTEEEAKKAMSMFNAMFMTAIEQDAIDEYKKFKENPDKRPLSFDKLVVNAYELYEAVDKGEL